MRLRQIANVCAVLICREFNSNGSRSPQGHGSDVATLFGKGRPGRQLSDLLKEIQQGKVKSRACITTR